jgi:hypothetical protein
MATITKTLAGTFRAIIRTKNKTITKTFKLRKLAKAWALRIEGDADLMAATGCKGASIPFSRIKSICSFWDGFTIRTGVSGICS